MNLSFGIGIDPLSEAFCYNIGGKLFLAPKDASFRPRVSCYYGTNTIVETSILKYTSYNGVTVGGGASVYFGESRQKGLDFDVMYIVSNEANVNMSKDVTKGFKISAGYRQKF